MRGVAVCSIHLLAKTVGYCRAFELCVVIDARRAEALGLVGIGATPSLRCATTKDRLPPDAVACLRPSKVGKQGMKSRSRCKGGTAKKGRESRRRRRHWAGRPVSSHLRRGDCLVIWELDRLDRRKIALLSFVMFRTQNTEV